MAMAVTFLLGFSGCLDNNAKQPRSLEPTATSKQASTEAQKMIAAGKAVYYSSCIACHNADPSLPGPVGPDLTGSSIELIRSKVMEGTYPDGYSPKRPTKLMVPLPHLKEQIPAIHAFLNQ